MTEQTPESIEAEGVAVVSPDDQPGVDVPDDGEPEPGAAGDPDHGLPGDAEPLPDDDADKAPAPDDDDDSDPADVAEAQADGAS